MSLLSHILGGWLPEASGSVPAFGGEYCRDTKGSVLIRAVAVGSSIALFHECNRRPLQSFVQAKDEEMARRIADLFMRHQGWRLGDLGNLEFSLRSDNLHNFECS
jgi:hypothetical protein